MIDSLFKADCDTLDSGGLNPDMGIARLHFLANNTPCFETVKCVASNIEAMHGKKQRNLDILNYNQPRNMFITLKHIV